MPNVFCLSPYTLKHCELMFCELLPDMPCVMLYGTFRAGLKTVFFLYVAKAKLWKIKTNWYWTEHTKKINRTDGPQVWRLLKRYLKYFFWLRKRSLQSSPTGIVFLMSLYMKNKRTGEKYVDTKMFYFVVIIIPDWLYTIKIHLFSSI